MNETVKIPQLRFRIFEGTEVLREETTTKARVSLGRSPTCDIVLPSKHVSNLHAYVETRKGAIRIIDANSTNGIYVNGEKTTRAILSPGDRVGICNLTIDVDFANSIFRSPTEPELSGGWEEYLEDDKSSEHTKFVLLAETEQQDKMGETATKPSAAKPASVAQDQSSKKTTKDSTPGLQDYLQESWLCLDTPPNLVPVGEQLLGTAAQQQSEDQLVLEMIYFFGKRVTSSRIIKPAGISNTWLGPENPSQPIAGVIFNKHLLTLLTSPGAPWRFQTTASQPQKDQFLLEPECEVIATRGSRRVVMRAIKAPKPERPKLSVSPERHRPVRMAAAIAISIMVHILTFLVPKETPEKQLAFVPVPKSIEWIKVALKETPPPEPQVAEKEVEQEAMLQEHKSRLAKTRKGQEKRAIEKRPTKGEDVQQTLSNVREQPGETLKQPVRQNTSDLSDFKVAGYLGHLPTLQPLSEKSPLNRGGGFTRMGAGQAPRPAVIKDTQSTVIKFGTIDMKELTMTINAQAYRIEQCYTDALKQFSLPSGTIRLNWQVNESGRAQKVNVLRNDVGSRTLVECMRQTLGTWEFPKPSGGAAEVSFSFRFSNPNF